MKLRSTTAAAALFLAAGLGIASAQTVVVTPEQETVIREYVQTHSVASVEVPDVEITVGATLPETVELHTIDNPEIKYSYVVVDGRTVLVEPETRKVVHVIE
ncbi:DUF1236 domain-containing protein [Chelativorans sp.]|uniref:DUF1236 domain-containing protein n=1 Tax=Chelativorans sp. TaxID=2203393 RepID=UPI002811D64F|nr:DUF1236 domain-containing protein [Chelativorans sp.]